MLYASNREVITKNTSKLYNGCSFTGFNILEISSSIFVWLHMMLWKTNKNPLKMLIGILIFLVKCKLASWNQKCMLIADKHANIRLMSISLLTLALETGAQINGNAILTIPTCDTIKLSVFGLHFDAIDDKQQNR